MKNRILNLSICNLFAISLLFLIGSSCKDDTPVMPKELEKLPIVTALIPAGTFTMGSPATEAGRKDDEKQHTVKLSKFRMSKYEITNAQFAAFLNAKNIGSDLRYAAGTYPTEVLIYPSSFSDWGLHFSGTQWVPVAGFENHPAIFVTWYGATEFASYVGGTLPSEAQWEYACRAAKTTPFNTGNYITNMQANYDWSIPYIKDTNTDYNGLGKTQAVGTYAANAYDLYDMHGNVLEWCSDWYGTYPDNAQTNPTGVAMSLTHVIRGGSWNESARNCRSAHRTNYESFVGLSYIGFRVVFVL